MKIDIVRVIGKHIVHRQIEQRDGMTFMRMKRRAVDMEEE